MGAPQTLPADFQGWDKAPQTLPADFSQWDQPAQQQSTGLKNPKLAQAGGLDMEQMGKTADRAIEQVKGAAKQVYDVSAPGIAEQIYRHMQGLPNTLHELPGKMVLAFLTAGGLGPEIEAAAAKHSAPEVIESAAKEAEAAPKVNTSPKAVLAALEDALGVKKPIKGVALKDQAAAQSAKLPEGFTPTESSAIKGYRYSPERQELEAVAKTGEHYIHGDVSPEQFGKFVESPSRGKAWNQLKGNATLVAKVINGKRTPVRPAITE